MAWQKTYGGTGFDSVYDLVACSDGNFLLVGRSGSSVSGNCTETTNGLTDYWVLKVDGSGNIIWQKKYGGNELDNLYTAIEAPDGGYLLL
ncbi:MAG TPA: T9SS C-terminal target domain-containing protein, partial [Flavobacteriaceae bacterium]|nr:T9SS C-terminal target domain-containing protein [Flavobacteriaceae bacterium]